VTNSAGGVGQSTLHVTVNNAPPQVTAGVNQSTLEGDVVLFNGTFTDLGSMDTHTIQWAFGDGASASGVLTPTHVYADNPQGASGSGVYTATLTVTDKDGDSGIGTVLVTVDNVAPIVDAGLDQTVARGQAAAFNGLFTDPGIADTHTISWNFGDGHAGCQPHACLCQQQRLHGNLDGHGR
jgi:PKD repeat protein